MSKSKSKKGKKKIRDPELNQGKKINLDKSFTIPNQTQNPVFCFQHLHHKYNINYCERKEKAQLIDNICKVSKKPWNELLCTINRQGLGAEKMPFNQLSIDRPDWLTEDITYLHVFHFGRNKVYMGYKDQFIFRIIAIDPKGEVYDHGS